MECPIGLCKDEDCPNYYTCEQWGRPWPLPYTYKDGCLLIEYHHLRSKVDFLGFEDLEIDLLKEWQDTGFFEAWNLPYEYDSKQKVLEVILTNGGFRVALPLPYVVENEGLNVCDVCPSARDAGWADAWDIGDDDPPF
jgi:hypothetical protein